MADETAATQTEAQAQDVARLVSISGTEAGRTKAAIDAVQDIANYAIKRAAAASMALGNAMQACEVLARQNAAFIAEIARLKTRIAELEKEPTQ